VEWVKLCIDDGSGATCNPSGGFQMHAVGAYKRDSGAHTMAELEQFFTTAVGGMAAYDPFMELHVGLMTSNLDYYVSAFKAASVPAFASSFTAAGSTYYSLTVQVPGSIAAGAGSLILVELIGSKSALLSARADLHRHPVARASPQALEKAQSHLATAPHKTSGAAAKPVLTLMKISFPSSDVARDVKFFEGVLKGVKVYEETNNGTTIYAGQMVAGDAAEMHFVQSAAATQGPMSVAQWEAYQVALHAKCVGFGTGFDRLADNHVGHRLGQGVSIDGYVAEIKAAGYPYRFYHMGPTSGPSFLYFYAPNGWGTQVIGKCTTCPAAKGYNMCTQGITGSCSKDLPSDEDEA
jgi:hypothetical protein